jgi:glycosyltransferase involved in cell wall biosynthesis
VCKGFAPGEVACVTMRFACWRAPAPHPTEKEPLRIAPGRVSVIIPTHNRADLIDDAILSALNQSAAVHEVLVVDDGSTDATAELVRGYGDPVVLITQDHHSAAAARNRGIAQASGEWIAFLDSDDVWTPSKLEEQLEYAAAHPACGLLHTGYYEFGDQKRVPPSAPRFRNGEHAIDRLLVAEDWICISSVLVRSQAVAPFREWAASSEDIIFFADLIRAGVRFGYLHAPLVGHRVHAVSANREAGAQACGLSVQWRWILENYASQLCELRRLQANVLSKAGRAMHIARSSRDWRQYWEWRDWLTDHWPAGESRPPALDERIYAPILYDVKDRVEKFVPRIGGARAGSRR